MLMLGTAGFTLSAVALGSRNFVIAVLLLRASLEPIFELTKVDPSSGGIGAALNLVVIVVAARYFLSDVRPALPLAALMWGPFFAIALVALAITPDPSGGFRFFCVLLSYFAVFLVPFYLVRKQADIAVFLKFILLSSLVPALVGLVGIFTVPSTEDEGFRIAATFSHPNVFAFYLILMLFVALLLLTLRERPLTRLQTRAISLYIPVLMVLLLMTKTRAAWIAAALMLVVYAVRFDRRYLGYMLGGAVLALASPAIQERLSSLGDGNVNENYAKLNSLAWRQLLWHDALQFAQAKPLFGYGLTSFRTYATWFFTMPIEDGDTVDPHSVYVLLRFETGTLGVLAFAWLFVVLLVVLYRSRRVVGPPYLLCMAFTCCYLLVCSSDNMMWYLVFNWYYWFVMGCFCAAWSWQSRATRVPGMAPARSAGLALRTVP